MPLKTKAISNWRLIIYIHKDINLLECFHVHFGLSYFLTNSLSTWFFILDGNELTFQVTIGVTTCDTSHSFGKQNLNKLDMKDGILASSPTKPFSTLGISDIILLIFHFKTSVFKKKNSWNRVCWLNFPCHIFYKESRKNKWE
jgi:hypothetical protein